MSWLKCWRFLSSSDPLFKAVTSGFILLNRQRGLHQHLPGKKDLETVHVASHIVLCSLSIKRHIFAFRSQRANNQRSQRTRRVSTNPGTGVKNKSYGNVPKFRGRAIMSTWNSVQGSLDWNPCGQKGTSVSLSRVQTGIYLITCKLKAQTVLPQRRFNYQWSASVENQQLSVYARIAARCFNSLGSFIKATFRWLTWNLSADRAGTWFDTLSLS